MIQAVINEKNQTINLSLGLDGGKSFMIPKNLSEEEVKEKIKVVKELITLYNEEPSLENRKEIYENLIEAVNSKGKSVLKMHSQFEIDDKGALFLKGSNEAIPVELASKFLELLEEESDNESVVNSLTLFWKRLLLNPDKRVRHTLHNFITHNDIGITSNGYILAVKSVKLSGGFDKETGKRKVEYSEESGEVVELPINSSSKFIPHHSGTHGMEIRMGEAVEMPREECDSDPNNTCSRGLHVGSWDYVKDFGSYGADNVILEVLVCPSQVVAVPTDYNGKKMRCCVYYPFSLSVGENTKIYRETDFDFHSSEKINQQFEKYKAETQKVIKELESTIDLNSAIIDELY